MTDGEGRGIVIDRHATLLTVDIGLVGRKAQLGKELRRTQELPVGHHITVIFDLRLTKLTERQSSDRLEFLCLETERRAQAAIGLILEGEFLAIEEHHLVDARPLEGYHEVILIRRQETITWCTYVIDAFYLDVTLRILKRHILLVDERVGQRRTVVVALTAPAVTVIDGTVPALVQVGGCLDTQLTAPSVILVAREQSVHRGDIQLVGVTHDLDGVLDEGIQTEHDILEALDVLNLLDEVVHRVLALRQFHLAVLVPEVLASHAGVRFPDLRALALEQLLGQFGKGVVR